MRMRDSNSKEHDLSYHEIKIFQKARMNRILLYQKINAILELNVDI